MGAIYFLMGVLFAVCFCIGLEIIDSIQKNKARKKFLKDVRNVPPVIIQEPKEDENAKAIAESLERCKKAAIECAESLKKLSDMSTATWSYTIHNKLRAAYGLPPITQSIDIVKPGDLVTFSFAPYSMYRVYRIDGSYIYDSNGVISDWRRISAIYRSYGANFKCIWSEGKVVE